jgi:hypothetical protein
MVHTAGEKKNSMTADRKLGPYESSSPTADRKR